MNDLGALVNDLAVSIVAGLIAGAMNAIAGGGSFITLPALMAVGVPAINANATSTLALVPGALSSAYAYRKDFQELPGSSLRALAGLSILGGACGAVLLIVTPQQIFANMVPWLMLFATLVFAFGRQAGGFLRARISINPSMIYVSQFFLGVYGGYFGGELCAHA